MIREIASAAASTIPLLIPPFTHIPQTPTPTPTTEITITSIPAILDFSSLFGFDQRVSVLEKKLSQLKQVMGLILNQRFLMRNKTRQLVQMKEPDVPKDQSKSENESWGNSKDDDSNDDNSDDVTSNDDDDVDNDVDGDNKEAAATVGVTASLRRIPSRSSLSQKSDSGRNNSGSCSNSCSSSSNDQCSSDNSSNDSSRNDKGVLSKSENLTRNPCSPRK
nr:hypothetical protein [Tanacetum cinerariifolium]